jgi:flagellar hook protein FlgE
MPPRIRTRPIFVMGLFFRAFGDVRMSLSSVSTTALSGISAAETALAVTADNLANLQTPGFKPSTVVLATQTPGRLSPGTQVGTGVQIAQIATNPSQGTLVPAASQLTLAVEGEGYFVVEDGEGQRLYTRDGNFQINARGQLVTQSGFPVIGWTNERNLFDAENPPLFILEGSADEGTNRDPSALGVRKFQIGNDGQIRGLMSDGSTRSLGQLRLARFNNSQGLKAVGKNLHLPTANSGPAVSGVPGRFGMGRVVPGRYEASTTDVGRSLIEMSRAELLFKVNLGVLRTADSLWGELLRTFRR